MAEKTITAKDAGCWLLGAHGWHNGYRVVEIAEEYGFTLSVEERIALDVYRANDTDDSGYDDSWERVNGQGGLCEKATEHLESLAPVGYHFEWDAGELCLLPCDQIEGHDPADCEEMYPGHP